VVLRRGEGLFIRRGLVIYVSNATQSLYDTRPTSAASLSANFSWTHIDAFYHC
jgi:hypothetical protein